MSQQVINVYARNFRYTADENKPLLSKLTSALKENQWLNVSKSTFKPEQIRNIYRGLSKDESYDLKPSGSWFSKGSWLFHEDMCCKMDDELNMIEVDYAKIYRICGKEFKQSFDYFTTKYGRVVTEDGDMCDFRGYITDKDYVKKYTACHSKKNKAQCAETPECSWYEMPLFNSYDWKTISQTYNGFAMYPIPSKTFINSAGLNRTSLLSYDVESLVLWDARPIIKYWKFGKIRDIIGTSGTKHYQEYLPRLTKNLVKIINTINTK